MCNVLKPMMKHDLVPNKDIKKIILFKNDQTFRKDAHCSENYFFSTRVFFRATFSFRDMVDFAYG